MSRKDNNTIIKKPIIELNRMKSFDYYMHEVFVDTTFSKKTKVVKKTKKYKDEDIFVTVYNQEHDEDSIRIQPFSELKKDERVKEWLYLLPVLHYREETYIVDNKRIITEKSYSLKPDSNLVKKKVLFITLKYLPEAYVKNFMYKKYFINTLIYDHIIVPENINNKITCIGTEAFGLLREYIDRMFNRDTLIKELRKQALKEYGTRYLKSSDTFAAYLILHVCRECESNFYDKGIGIKIIPSMRKNNAVDYYIISVTRD